MRRPHPEQISALLPRFRRTQSFRRLAGSSISLRQTRYPGHPRILVQSLSLKLPSVPEKSAYADLVVPESRVDLLGRAYEASVLIFVNSIWASSSEHPIRVENSPRKSIPLQTSFSALLMMRSSSDVNSTSMALILPEQKTATSQTRAVR